MLDFLKAIRDAGVPHDMPPEEAKYIRLVNMWTALMIVANIAFLALNASDPGIFFLLFAIVEALLVLVIFFNLFRLHSLARVFLLIVVNAATGGIAVMSGAHIQGQYLLFLTAAAAPLIFPRKERGLMVAMIVLSFVTYVATTRFQQRIDPIVSDPRDPLSIAVVEWLLYAGVVGLALVGRIGSSQTEHLLKEEREHSERLLLNILPEEVAHRLKHDSGVIAQGYESASVLFADVVGFTAVSSTLDPDRLVRGMNDIVSAFDDMVEELGLEKIKTIGDGYMAAGGVPVPCEDHAERTAELAIRMQRFMNEYSEEKNIPLKLRIGINTGPLVAGVIGKKKFAYDLWGDTVNTAARMESHGEPGRIHLSESARKCLGENYQVEERGHIEVKGKGRMRSYFLTGTG